MQYIYLEQSVLTEWYCYFYLSKKYEYLLHPTTPFIKPGKR